MFATIVVVAYTTIWTAVTRNAEFVFNATIGADFIILTRTHWFIVIASVSRAALNAEVIDA
jgi:hypothetical protein